MTPVTLICCSFPRSSVGTPPWLLQRPGLMTLERQDLLPRRSVGARWHFPPGAGQGPCPGPSQHLWDYVQARIVGESQDGYPALRAPVRPLRPDPGARGARRRGDRDREPYRLGCKGHDALFVRGRRVGTVRRYSDVVWEGVWSDLSASNYPWTCFTRGTAPTAWKSARLLRYMASAWSKSPRVL